MKWTLQAWVSLALFKAAHVLLQWAAAFAPEAQGELRLSLRGSDVKVRWSRPDARQGEE